MIVFYNACLILYLLVSAPYCFFHLLLKEHYRAGLRQRLGFVRVRPQDAGIHVWFHGVSVGEIQVLLDLGQMLQRSGATIRPVYSTTTLTAQRLAATRLGPDADLIYFPLDIPFAVRRALDRVRPALVVVAETELWPNFLNECSARKIPVVIVNGRISDRSFGRYRMIRSLTSRILPLIEKFCMQSEIYAARIIALGAPPDRVIVTGNMKADAFATLGGPPSGLKDFFLGLRRYPDTRIIVAGSTHPGEEAVLAGLFGAWKKRFPHASLVLAPRHIVRVPAIVQELAGMGLNCTLRSGGLGNLQPEDGVVILDTLGELAWAYGWADVVFIGKSLFAMGGQNPIEAARQGKPVIFGPHMENFSAEAQALVEAGGALQVRDAAAMAAAVEEILGSAIKSTQMGQRAQEAVKKMSGAAEKNLQIIQALCASIIPCTDQRRSCP